LCLFLTIASFGFRVLSRSLSSQTEGENKSSHSKNAASINLRAEPDGGKQHSPLIALAGLLATP